MSGSIGENLTLSFLSIENKISKAGYHKRFTIKYGENSGLFLNKIINVNPV
tara:strand:+ start:347 stop:499 length:153 start_codon:yes stop_codon:yes gene_type:complete